MKRFNCEKASCSICSKATVVKGLFGIKRYKCPRYEGKKHKKIHAKDCLDFRCNPGKYTKECDRCRKGERRRH